MLYRLASWLGFALAFLFFAAVAVRADITLLNVSYDVARELYKDINAGLRRRLENEDRRQGRQDQPVARRLQQAGACRWPTGSMPTSSR